MQLKPWSPPWWARGGHLQTILGHLLRGNEKLGAGQPVCIELPDGDSLAATFLQGTSPVLVHLFHGLGGSTEGSYMVRTAKLLHRAGMSVLLVNHRGCGEGVRLVARKPYHSGRAEDLSAAIEFGRSRFPAYRHLAVGFSLSANALLLLMGGQRGKVQPDAAIAVNAPIDLEKSALALKRGISRVYDLRFVEDCRRAVAHRVKMGWTLSRYRLPLWATVHDLDAIYTAPEAGFESREHYYRTCSAKHYLNQIEKPTFVLMAKDDPFVDVSDYEMAEVSGAVRMFIQETGGHMGYLSAEPTELGTRHWMEYALVRMVEELLRQISSIQPSQSGAVDATIN